MCYQRPEACVLKIANVAYCATMILFRHHNSILSTKLTSKPNSHLVCKECDEHVYTHRTESTILTWPILPATNTSQSSATSFNLASILILLNAASKL